MKFLTKKSKVVIFVFGLIFIIFLLNVFQKEVRGFFYYISAPIQKVFFRVGERSADFKELDELKLKNQELLTKIAHLKEVEKENEFLREALRIEPQKDFKLTLAQIIGKDISQDFILIDKGSKDGISKNMPVITQQKVLVGRVWELYNNFSKVMLISNKKSSFDGKIQKEGDDVSGIIKGEGNFKILFDLVPREKELLKGEVVQTSALAGVFPSGLLVGEVKEIKKNDLETFQQAEIEPAFDIKNLDLLLVILDF